MMEGEKNSSAAAAANSSDSFRVVLASVTNILYPVDIDLIHYLFSKYGEVEKIVTFSKTPTMYQALIQFQNAEQARHALANLHTRNIYDRCNTLQIQPSRLEELIVKTNCAKSWDYTIQSGGPNGSSLPGGVGAAGGIANAAAAANAGAGGGMPPCVGGGVVVDGQQQQLVHAGVGGAQMAPPTAVNNGNRAAAGVSGGVVAGGLGGSAHHHHHLPPAVGAAGTVPTLQQQQGVYQQQQHVPPPLPAGSAVAQSAAAAGGPPRGPLPHYSLHHAQQQHAAAAPATAMGMQPPPPNHHVGLGGGVSVVGQQQQHAAASAAHHLQHHHLTGPAGAAGSAVAARLGGPTALGLGGAGHPHSHGSNLLRLLEKVPRELRELDMEATNPTQTPVIIVYNLPPNTTVPMLFNLFSLYGAVLRVKILREKSDTALIQYSDPLYATIAHNFIQGASVLGQSLQVGFSKNMEVKLPPSQNKTDGATANEEEKRTVAFSTRDQRYGGDDVEKYVKGACRPTKTIFVANLDEHTTEEEITKLFAEHGTVSKFTFKAPKNESAKTQMAMMEMGSEAEAVAAVMHIHNHELHGRSMKVAFSKTVL